MARLNRKIHESTIVVVIVDWSFTPCVFLLVSFFTTASPFEEITDPRILACKVVRRYCIGEVLHRGDPPLEGLALVY